MTGWDFYEVLPTLTEKSVEYVRSQKGNEKPFFLFLPFPSPHAPIIPNDEFGGKSGAGAYGDVVFQTDDACGRVMRAIEEIGESDNTIVIFTADNGPEYYAYERDKKYGHSTELYHFSEDPGQRHNLAEKYPEKVKEMQALLKKLREQGHSAPRLD